MGGQDEQHSEALSQKKKIVFKLTIYNLVSSTEVIELSIQKLSPSLGSHPRVGQQNPQPQLSFL